MIIQEIQRGQPRRRKRKRVGRGIGSGRGKTCTRGQNGQHSRSGSGGKLGHEGGTMPLFRRLPKRGFNNKRFRVDYATVNVGQLDQVYAAGETVSLETAREKGLVKKSARRLKVLGQGDLSRALTVKAAVSAQARAKVEAAKGSVEGV